MLAEKQGSLNKVLAWRARNKLNMPYRVFPELITQVFVDVPPQPNTSFVVEGFPDSDLRHECMPWGLDPLT